ncbi:hypothetical protein GR254_08325, partial [Mycobacterium tuberculosis]|nr:hypothetical protein [Mycobacterium tuberculosis]
MRSATRRRSPRWSTSPGRHCPKTSTPPPGRPPDPDSGLRQGYAGAHRTLGQGGHGGQTWLHSISTQHVSDLPEGASTQNLSLDGQGRVE